jgi:DNA-binding SARP family transcriptional activator/tetratricopeptide (TPR) repeat protein
MDFRILGPLEVRDGGRVVPVRGPRKRALLALLLVNANEAVSDDRLVEELWRDETPASGSAALRVRISQLRKTLGPGVVASRAPGYALEVDPERIDAQRFERMLATARRLRADGSPAVSARTLRDALALWRGGALADFAYEPWAAGAIARLEALRLDAIEERIDADLELGGHAELVGELQALVAEQPFRERLHGQLMVALYRSGRQADSLAAYQAVRATFAEQLGIEPGQELRRLQEGILHQAAWLDPPSSSDDADLDERKVVTVLAATCEVGESDPERARAVLKRRAATVGSVIEAAGGRVEGEVGATLVASFGAPVAQEDHAGRALGAALLLMTGRCGDGVGLRIGVETGEALVGAATTGAVLVQAMQLERAAASGEILVGDRAVAATRPAFEFGDARRLGRPLRRSLADGPARTRRQTPFVGRERELDLLDAAYRAAVATGRSRAVAIVGEAGIGKSRLVAELRDRVADPAWHIGRCLPFGTAYGAFADVLREHLGVLETDPAEAVLDRLGPQRILGLTLGLDVAPRLHPLAARDQLHEAWVDLLEQLASAGPAILVIEDLHWAQEPVSDLLARVAGHVRGSLLVVTTARPEARPPGGVVALGPLSDDEMAHALGDVDAALRQFVLDRAEGNPFFAEELLAIAPHSATATPDGVHSVLAARIDLLPSMEKAALQASAVLGRRFRRDALRGLLDGADPDLALLEQRHFVTRHEDGFAFKHALTRDVAYATLTKARRASLHARAGEWLERTATEPDAQASVLAHHWFKAARPEDADLAWDDADALGRAREKALRWSRIGAVRAIGRYDLDQALAHLHDALTIAPDDETRCDLWRLLGRVHALRFDGEAFWTALGHAIQHAGDDRTRGELYADLAYETCNRSGMWARRPGAEVVDRWIEQASTLADPDSAASARAAIAYAFTDPASARGSADRAAAIAEHLRDPELLATAWDAQRVVAHAAGDWDRELQWAERRLGLLDEITDPDLRADILSTLVPIYVRRGAFEKARRAARDNDETTAALTPHHRVHGIAVQLEVREAAGRWDEIVALEERCTQTVAANARTPCVRNARAVLVCAAARVYAGDPARAEALEERAGEVALDGFGHVLDTPRLRLALARGDLGRVEELVAQPPSGARGHVVGRTFSLITLATRLDALAALGDRHRIEREAPPLLEAGAYLEPFALRALGVAREDGGLLEAATAHFESLGLEWHAAQMRSELSRAADRASP